MSGRGAARAVEQIRAVLQARADQRRWSVLIWGLGLTIVATAFLLAVLWLVRRGADRALERVTRAMHPRATRLLGLDLWPFLHAAERTAVGATAWGLALVAVYLWLAFVLQQFPYTRLWGAQLGAYIVDLVRELGTGALYALRGPARPRPGSDPKPCRAALLPPRPFVRGGPSARRTAFPLAAQEVLDVSHQLFRVEFFAG